MSVAAIVLAAGRGTRFGERAKVLADFRGKPLVRHVAEAALAGCGAPTIVVVGHRGEAVAAALDGLAVTIVCNPDFADGLSTSLRAGFSALSADSEAAAILLADMPLVCGELLRVLVEAWAERGRPAALVPTFLGRRGNPVILSRALAPEVEALTGDAGAGPLLRRRSGIVELEVGEAAVSADVDTPDALASLERVQASTTPSRIAT